MHILLYIALLISAVHSYSPAPRWGQATSLITSSLFIQGGKQSLDNSQSYTSADAVEDLLLLSLTDQFTVDSPPWQLISNHSNSTNSQGPAVAWHTLSAFNSSELLIFGGMPTPTVPNFLSNDSAWLLDVFDRRIPEFHEEPPQWGNEPLRRIHHAAVSSTAGDVYIFGGERSDYNSLVYFSDNYVFSPGSSSFSALPTDNAPPAMTGHAAVILSNQVLIFGGATVNGLNTLDTFWIFDIGSNSWSTQIISSSAPLPSSRRAFAYVLLDDNTILIHGGCTQDLTQPNFSDGWIFNISSQSWTSVPELSAIGDRRDHFAIEYGGQVIFGFGYGDNGPANASLIIYDPTTGGFPNTFTPPPPTASITPTIPIASATPTTTATSHLFSGTVSGSVHPTSTGGSGGGDGGGDSNRKPQSPTKKATAIAIGVVLGVLAFVAAALGVVWYMRRQQRRRWMEGGVGGVFSPLDGDDRGPAAARMVDAPPPEHGVVGGAVESIGATLHTWGAWAAGALGLGVVGSGAVAAAHDRKQRRDMLADEDTRDFGYAGWYDVGDSTSMRSRLERLRQGSGGSTWSLKSIFRPKPRREGSAMSGMSFNSRGESLAGHGVDPSEKDPFHDDVYAVGRTVRPVLGRRQSSYASVASNTSGQGYVDPFADPISVSERDLAGPGALLVHNIGHARPGMLSPVTEVSRSSASQSGSSNDHHTPLLSPFDSLSRASTFGYNSSSSHANSPFSVVSPAASAIATAGPGPSTLSAGTAARPRTSSILDMQPPPPEKPMRRSDTWWARFANKSLLDRRSSRGGGSSATRTAPTQAAFEFRDPNPLPQRLGFVQEETGSMLAGAGTDRASSDGSSKERSGGARPSGSHYGRVAGHGKSMSSLQTQQTADSAALERMGDVDVMVRGTRQGGSTSTRGSETTHGGSHGGSIDESNSHVRRSWIPPEVSADDEPVYTSPVEMVPASSFGLPTPPPPPPARSPSPKQSLAPSSRPPLSTASSSNSDKSSASAGSSVADRIRAYERRMSQDVSPPPPPTNTKTREERPRKKPHGVNYGLVARPSLFVANPGPDREASGSGDAA